MNNFNYIKNKLLKKIKIFIGYFLFSDIDYSQLTSKISKYSLCLNSKKIFYKK